MDINALLSYAVQEALQEVARAHSHGQEGLDISRSAIEAPPASQVPDGEEGDAGFAMFALAKQFHASPQSIAKEAAEVLNKRCGANKRCIESVEMRCIEPVEMWIAAGPYLNVCLDRRRVVEEVLKSGAQGESGNAERVMVEFSCPNTNKPLHLGHLRNDALGESLSRILRFAGTDVCKADLINDRGVHIMKSMLAYKMFHEAAGDTPESLHVKGDHFVGQCYVEYAKAEKDDPSLAQKAEQMLVKWEAGDKDVCELWQKMNRWTIDGIEETYRRTGVSFDKVYYESNTYLLGKDEVLRGLKSGVFFKAEDGSIRCDITDAVGISRDGKRQEKVLLRSDGTAVYITQDIGTAILRHKEWPYDKMIYVVASEQAYHFKALFYILRRLGYEWAKNLVHLSYGLVNLPEGRMKSREGTVVDADDLLDSLKADALQEIRERKAQAASSAEENDDIAEKVALGALHYYLLSGTPQKDMLFDPKKSLSFVGDTGPYLQYMCARITSILRKVCDEGGEESHAEMLAEEAAKYLTGDAEWALVKAIGEWPSAVKKAADKCDPSVVALWLNSCAKAFSKFYDVCPILQSETEVRRARLFLCKSTLDVMKTAMDLILVPYLERM